MVVCTSVQVAFTIFLNMLIFTAYVLVAADVNKQASVHKAILLRHQRECEMAVTLLDENPDKYGEEQQRNIRKNGINNASRMIDVALEQVNIELELYPATFLGAVADSALAKSIITVTGSLIPILYGLTKGMNLEDLGPG
eukprot:GFYU01028149.1.p1 GENE.GFYU01028149.1~~GFYU01028149.1.p1  ORF type:complete len:140 (-),score=34.86 GFYU01028149.1:113-532(-)